eukprot:7450730-Alexandrium_andersonii.AAC.1
MHTQRRAQEIEEELDFADALAAKEFKEAKHREVKENKDSQKSGQAQRAELPLAISNAKRSLVEANVSLKSEVKELREGVASLFSAGGVVPNDVAAMMTSIEALSSETDGGLDSASKDLDVLTTASTGSEFSHGEMDEGFKKAKGARTVFTKSAKYSR